MTATSPAGGAHLAAIFGRLWDDRAAFTPVVARHVLAIKLAESDIGRMRELNARNRTGKLTADEAVELDDFLRAADLLSILHSKARMRLKAKTRGDRG
jgi:hypothetical protein